MIYLPESFANWPWPRTINALYEEVSAESSNWLRGFGAFTAGAQKGFDKRHLRHGCDLMNVLFVIDEYTDGAIAPVVREMMEIITDAMVNPHKPRPEGEIVIGEICRQFWALSLESASPSAAKQFLDLFFNYLQSVIDEANFQHSETVPTIEIYLQGRRANVGMRPCFDLALNLPDEVFYHPGVEELRDAACELVFLYNDIASYNREQCVGLAGFNILTSVMHHLKLDLQGAIAWTHNRLLEVQHKFLECLPKVPSFGSTVDLELGKYFLQLANWPRANYCWSFEGTRYFGDRGMQVLHTRCVSLLPKVQLERPTSVENVVVHYVEL
ncbi:isoprenoid synthase domain-containing protein [Mycena leptocephala]|nr:isoprenoid synthase domain-containing protein [Mycena leptocephala]